MKIWIALLHHSLTVELGENTKAPTRILVEGSTGKGRGEYSLHA
jgi:hypothetical protein